MGEERMLAQIGEVTAFLAADDCKARLLMRHFGDHCPADFRCGKCDWCESGSALQLPERLVADVDPELWREFEQAVEQGTLPNDDARLLARVALGFNSPRIRTMKLKEHPLYDAFAGCDFVRVLEKCEALCSQSV